MEITRNSVDAYANAIEADSVMAHQVLWFAVVIVIERIAHVTLEKTFISRHGHCLRVN